MFNSKIPPIKIAFLALLLLPNLSPGKGASARSALKEADKSFQEGQSTLQAEPLEKAKAAYLALLDKTKDPFPLQTRLAQAFYYQALGEDLAHHRDPAKKWLDEGIRWAEKAAQLNPDDGEVHALLGDLYGEKIMLGDMFTAMDYGPKSGNENKKAFELAPKNAKVLAAQGRRFLNAPDFAGGDPKKGVSFFEDSLKKDPKSAETWVWLSKAYKKTNQPEKRKDAIEKALKLDPANLLAKMEMDDLKNK
jgi:tetratricopeptide (TPR) repeat protein